MIYGVALSLWGFVRGMDERKKTQQLFAPNIRVFSWMSWAGVKDICVICVHLSQIRLPYEKVVSERLQRKVKNTFDILIPLYEHVGNDRFQMAIDTFQKRLGVSRHRDLSDIKEFSTQSSSSRKSLHA
jgi:hypothetical protein